MKRMIYMLLTVVTLVSTSACISVPSPEATEPAAHATAVPTTVTAAPTIASVVVEVETKPTDMPEPPRTPEPSPTPSPTPEPTLTPEPTPTPEPTREPRPGDIAVNFPNYDTGADADYSYQSDELRVAIRITVDKETQQTHYVADLWIRNIDYFRTGFGRGKFNTGTEDGDKLAKRENAVFAVNGSYNRGLTFHNGTRTKGFLAAEKNNFTTWGTCFLYRDGTMKTYDLRSQSVNYSKAVKDGLWQAWQFGPALVQDGELAPNLTLKTRDPRNALGYYEPGHYVVVTCDGSRKDALGMTVTELAELMKGLGVKEAMNLDGGISAVMVFMGEIINRPEARKTDDGKTVYGRPLVDMLLFAAYDQDGKAPDLATLSASRYNGK